jgi:hypothetical protein
VSTAKVETFQTNRIPIVASTEAETTVLVKSGVTVIIGGLIETSDGTTDNRVPVLGDIPIVGRAFKSTTDTKKKTELVVFMTPQIILPDGTPFTFPETPAEAAGQAAVDSSIPAVTIADPVSAAYRETIRRRLHEAMASAFRAASLPKGSAVVAFVLSHDGQLIGEADISSPQGEPFIKATREALAKAQPFPSFPEGSAASEVRFKIAVEYAP